MCEKKRKYFQKLKMLNDVFNLILESIFIIVWISAFEEHLQRKVLKFVLMRIFLFLLIRYESTASS